MIKKYSLIQVDVDSLSTIASYYGSEDFDPAKDRLYEIAVPRLLDLFDRHHVRATFFISGKDFINNERTCFWIDKIIHKGHEIANHSFSHLARLSSRSNAVVEEEIAKNHQAIKDFFDVTCAGYRSPGYSISDDILRLLAKQGYLYDSSIFPTSISVLYKIYRKFTAYPKQGVSPTDMGPPLLFLSPREPYLLRNLKLPDGRPMAEIPVTTTRIGRLPFYFSFHLCLPEPVFRVMLGAIRADCINYVLHGTDILDFTKDRINDRFIARHTTIKIPLESKMKKLDIAMSSLSGRVNILSRDLSGEMLKTGIAAK